MLLKQKNAVALSYYYNDYSVSRVDYSKSVQSEKGLYFFYDTEYGCSSLAIVAWTYWKCRFLVTEMVRHCLVSIYEIYGTRRTLNVLGILPQSHKFY